MKKFFIHEKGVIKHPYYTFWQPWGGLGCLWRVLLFLFLLLLFLFFLLGMSSLLKGCSGRNIDVISSIPAPDPEIIIAEEDSIIDSFAPIDWPVTIPDSSKNKNLPDSGRNRIRPVNPDDMITDPKNEIRKIDSSHLFVILDSDANDETFNSFAQQFGQLYPRPECNIEYYNTLSKTLLLSVPSVERELIKQNLPKQITNISFYVINVEILNVGMKPNDIVFQYPKLSWQFAPIQAYEAWDITTGNPNVIVAIVDSYFELSHPDLKRINFVEPYSVERGNRDIRPEQSAPDVAFMHGTHVAGIALGNMNNQEGSTGIAPSCSFMPVSLGSQLTNYCQIEGILYAIYKGASVINLSFGSSFDRDALRQMSVEDQVNIAKVTNKEEEYLWNYIFKLCDERDVMLVWSAGNDNAYTALDESKRSNITIKVDAVDQKLNKAKFSNFGNLPEFNVEYSTVSAPGVDIVSSVPNHTYQPASGTSMAAPIVTGAVALMKSLNPTLSNAEIIKIIKETSKPLNDKTIGGLLQIKDALKKVQEDFLAFDDVINDHNQIIGTWEATRLINVLRNGETTKEKIKLYMIFTSATQGTVKLVEQISKEEYFAPLSVEYGTGKIQIHELEKATSHSGSAFSKSWYDCTPDKQGLFSVVNVQEGKADNVHFYLRKIK